MGLPLLLPLLLLPASLQAGEWPELSCSARDPGEGRQGWGAGGKQSQNWRCFLQMTGTSPKRGPGWWSSHVWLYFLFLL